MRIVLFLSLCAVFFSCANPDKSQWLKRVDPAIMDSLAKHSDSTWSKNYNRSDFVTARYYRNQKDSSLTQIMTDSANGIRQVITTVRGVRTFYAGYYPNGQLMADYKLDNYGKYHGDVTTYYENGLVKSTGKYSHGSYDGVWKEYDINGKVSNVVTYRTN